MTHSSALRVGGNHAELVGQAQAQVCQGVVHHLGAVGEKHHDAAFARPGGGFDTAALRVVEELGDRRLPAVGADARPRHSLGAEGRHHVGQRVQVLARQPAALRHRQRLDQSAAFRRLAKDTQLGAAHQVGHVGELEPEARVGTIRAVAPHRLGVSHAREGARHFEAAQRESGGEQLFDQLVDVLGAHERRFDVDLRELRLAVGAQILVAKAAHDLVVAVEAGDHEQLLEELRRLRKGVEAARIDAARHQVVARPLRRAAGEDRRLHVDETGAVEVPGGCTSSSGGETADCFAPPVAAGRDSDT